MEICRQEIEFNIFAENNPRECASIKVFLCFSAINTNSSFFNSFSRREFKETERDEEDLVINVFSSLSLCCEQALHNRKLDH